MFPIGGEHGVERAEGVGGACLGGFLPVGGDPEGELTLTLQRGGRLIEPTGESHLAVEREEPLRVEPVDEGRVRCRGTARRVTPLRRQEPDQGGAARGAHTAPARDQLSW